jgi:hypothetical protein
MIRGRLAVRWSPQQISRWLARTHADRHRVHPAGGAGGGGDPAAAGKAADVRGAARFLAEALTMVRSIAPTARIVVRGDSKFYTADVVATAARYGASVSLTTGANPSVNAAITQIQPTAWTPIHYPDAFVDEQTGQLISDAEVAEIGYTAFTGRPRGRQVAGRLIVRRVKRINPKAAPGQGELFTTCRHHAVFVTSAFHTLQAEAQHRGHAIVEQVIADAAASASSVGRGFGPHPLHHETQLPLDAMTLVNAQRSDLACRRVGLLTQVRRGGPVRASIGIVGYQSRTVVGGNTRGPVCVRARTSATAANDDDRVAGLQPVRHRTCALGSPPDPGPGPGARSGRTRALTGQGPGPPLVLLVTGAAPHPGLDRSAASFS